MTAWCPAALSGLVPGETTLIAAALLASKTQALNIWVVIACASAGAIIGDNLGYWIGREFGFRLLLRYGHYIGLSESRTKLGEYLFQRHALDASLPCLAHWPPFSLASIR